jgi:hypothetical protein
LEDRLFQAGFFIVQALTIKNRPGGSSMKKTVVYLIITLVLSMMGATNTYALDFGENMSIANKGLLILMVLQVIFLFIGASIAGIDHRTFGKAILSALGIAAFFFFMRVLTVERNIEIVGLVVVGILSIVVIQKIFDTTLMKALAAFLFTLGADAIAVLVIP